MHCTLSIIKKYGAAAGYHTRHHYPPNHTPTTADGFLIHLTTSHHFRFRSSGNPAFSCPPHFYSFLLCTYSRSLQKVCTPHTRFFVTKYIVRVLALGAVWLAKGPKISGQSYYYLNSTNLPASGHCLVFTQKSITHKKHSQFVVY